MGNNLSQIFMQVLHMSITGGMCIGVVLLLRLLFRKAPRKYLYVLWLVVAFRLVCPVSVSTVFSIFNLSSLYELETAERTMPKDFPVQEGSEYGIKETERSLLPDPAAVKADGSLPEDHIPRQERPAGKVLSAFWYYYDRGEIFRLLDPVKYIWAAGTAVFLACFSAGMLRLSGSIQMAVRVREPAVTDCEVYECDGLPSPFVMGIIRPGIYLPCHLEGEERRMVLLHEQYHIRRRDHLVKMLAFLLLAVYWFHPLVWAAWFGMCRDMEMSCDEKVLELLGEGHGKEYSRTLLSFASEKPCGYRMPLAFGEYDVKSRIQHALDFKKPAVWAGVLAVILLTAVMVLLGTNAVRQETPEAKNLSSEESEEGISREAQLLYGARNPYMGDASANGKLTGVIAEVLPESLLNVPFKTELQTGEEPYEISFYIEDTLMKEPGFAVMEAPAVLMLALTDNLGAVQWEYQDPDGRRKAVRLDREMAEELCGVEDIREYGTSSRKVQELLDILKQTAESRENEDVHAAADSEIFMDWYADLPAELCEEAVPWKEGGEYSLPGSGEEPYMVILAQTENQVVTVYGCCSAEYGRRGVIIDYRITKDGDSNHTYMDGYWEGTGSSSGYEVYMADYDRDGREEIALAEILGQDWGCFSRLTVFETYDTGHLEPSVFTREMYAAEIEWLVSTAVDEENHQVHVVENGTVSSTPLLTFSYEEDQEILDVFTDSDVWFSVGEELWLESTVGLRIKSYPVTWYGYAGAEQERTIRFRVVYDESSSLGGGYFTLTDPESE